MKKDFPYDVINDKFYAMESTSDFIQLLNEVKKKFFKGSSEKNIEQFVDLKPITINRIKFYLSNLKKESDDSRINLYKISKIAKKTGGIRCIHAPNSDLKIVLKCIDILLRSVYIPHPNAFAFIESKNIVDNAKMHTNKRFVYNIDLKDFFYSFDYNRVKMALYKTPFNLNTSKEKEEIAYWISILTTCKINGKQVLPQGSPASPVLTNIICTRFDDKLNRLSREFSLNYSRYADDITFSSDKQVFHGKFLRKLNGIIESEGFMINDSKVRLQNQGERQVVTGITVNKGTNVSHEYIQELRMYLYYIEQYGLNKALGYFLNDKRNNQVNNSSSLDKINESYFQKTLKGKLNFLSMVKGKSDPVYSKLSNRYNELFPDQKTSFMEHIALICRIASINTARRIYDDKNKKRNYKTPSSLNFSEIEYADFIDLNEEESDKEQEKKRAIIDKMNQSQPKEKKEPTELQLNINFLRQILAEENIGLEERHFIFEAFSKYISAAGDKDGDKNIKGTEKKVHKLLEVQKILMQFNQNPNLKYLTHPIDIPDSIGSYSVLMENAKSLFKEMLQLKDLDYNLWSKVIDPFIFQTTPPKDDKNNFQWGVNKIPIGWQYPTDVKDWCQNNFDNLENALMPQAMDIIPPLRINNRTISRFEHIIDFFNKEIRFENDELYQLLDSKIRGINMEMENPEKFDKNKKLSKIYVNTSKVSKAITKIFSMIVKCKEESRKYTIESTTDDEYITLKIAHINSFTLEGTDLINASKGGNLEGLISELINVCDFSIETKMQHNGKSLRYDYLYQERNVKDILEVKHEELNYNVNGFTFVLKFLLPK